MAGSATLVLDGNSNTIGNLNDAGTVENANVAAATLTVGGGDATGGSFSGVISDGSGGGALSLTKSGTGTQTLSGTNTYTGTTTVSAGTLQAGSTQAFGVNSDTTVAGSAVLLLDGNSNTIGNLDGAGSVVGDNDTATAATLTVGGGDATGGTFSGVISDGTGGGALSLTKTGTGTQTLSGANTYTGATNVNAGTLDLGGSGATLGGSMRTSSLTTVASGATLAGSGTTGALTIDVGGLHKPGQSPGITASGDYTLNGDLEIEVDDSFTGGTPTAGTDFDQVDVTGTVTLGGTSTLTPLEFGTSNAFNPDFGTVFSIINNDGADAVSGTFSNFADGADAITIDSHTLKVYYNADGSGDGNLNDVVLVNATGPATELYVDADFTAGVVDGNQEAAAPSRPSLAWMPTPPPTMPLPACRRPSAAR